MANEKRLIDANELKKNYTYLWDEALGTCECVLVEDIEAAPTVDAVEVVHGRWEKRDANEVYTSLSVHLWRCSVCKRGVPYGYTGFHYCPNCGAKMDGDGNG